MKRIITLLLSFTIALQLNGQISFSSQSYKLEVPNMFKVKRGTNFVGFYGRQAEKHYVLRLRKEPRFKFSGSEFSIEEYDKKLNFIRESEDPFTHTDFGGSWFYPRLNLGMRVSNSEIFIFTRGEGSEPRSHSVYRQRIDPTSLEPNKKVFEEFISIQDDKFKKHSRGDFKLFSSEDNSKHLIVHFYPEEGFTSFQYKVFVFDRNWQKLYERTITLPLLTALTDFKNLEITSDGQVHLLLKSYKDKREEYLKDQPNYKLKLITCKDADSEYSVIEVQARDYRLRELNMALAPNGDLVIAANAIGLKTQAPVKMFCSRLRPSEESVVFTSYGHLPLGSMKKDLEKGFEEATAYSQPKICFAEDGSVFCLAERQARYWARKTDINGNIQSGKDLGYTFFGIIVSHFDAAGKDDWSKFIFKKQETVNDGAKHSSFYAMAHKDVLHVFYTDFDEVRNLSWFVPISLFTHHQFRLDGKERKRLMFDTTKLKRMPVTKDGLRMSADQIIFPVDARKKAGLIRITVKN